jgi:hypothetical protein
MNFKFNCWTYSIYTQPDQKAKSKKLELGGYIAKKSSASKKSAKAEGNTTIMATSFIPDDDQNLPTKNETEIQFNDIKFESFEMDGEPLNQKTNCVKVNSGREGEFDDELVVDFTDDQYIMFEEALHTLQTY